MNWFIGTSGWSYKDWQGRFYPKQLSGPVSHLKYYAENFNATEVNSTFYNTPGKETLEQWIRNTPDDFRFVIKINRYFSHMKRLKSDEAASEKYETFRHLPDILDRNMGPILVQLPGTMKKNLARLEAWLNFMPDFRYAFEFRHPSWFDQEVYRTLEKHNAALVYSHNRDFPTDLKCTANFMYLRFQGPEKPYYSKYSHSQIASEFEKINLFQDDCQDIFVFFNNTYQAYAAENARQWKDMIS